MNKDHLVRQVCQDLLGLEACQVHEVTKVRRVQWVSLVNLVEMVTEVHWAYLEIKVCISVCVREREREIFTANPYKLCVFGNMDDHYVGHRQGKV